MDNSFLHRKKLLLVDDEPDLLKMVSDILKDGGFETVLTAASVKEAVMVAKQEKPDLMILDVMLPDGDGFSLMEQLRTFTDVPIIFLTAKDEAADKLAGLGLGADDYISKPFMPQELLLRVYAVLRRTYKEDSPELPEGYRQQARGSQTQQDPPRLQEAMKEVWKNHCLHHLQQRRPYASGAYPIVPKALRAPQDFLHRARKDIHPEPSASHRYPHRHI